MTDDSTMKRRQLLLTAAASFIALTQPWRLARAATEPEIQVYKSPTCGCCSMWVEHLQRNGFAVTTQDLPDLANIKRMAGVPDHLVACHTALIEGYTVEGHIPAIAIQQLLSDRPDVRGIAVPGMPAGSPGMPDPNPERYDVIAFGDEADSVFMSFVGETPA